MKIKTIIGLFFLKIASRLLNTILFDIYPEVTVNNIKNISKNIITRSFSYNIPNIYRDLDYYLQAGEHSIKQSIVHDIKTRSGNSNISDIKINHILFEGQKVTLFFEVMEFNHFIECNNKNKKEYLEILKNSRLSFLIDMI